VEERALLEVVQAEVPAQAAVLAQAQQRPVLVTAEGAVTAEAATVASVVALVVQAAALSVPSVLPVTV